MALVALGTRITTRLRGREDDDGGMVVTDAIVNGLKHDRLALLATLEGVDVAVERACDLVNGSFRASLRSPRAQGRSMSRLDA
jgi:hypothetical protein